MLLIFVPVYSADGSNAEKRVDIRQDLREDRKENVGDVVEDRQEFRENRTDSIGEVLIALWRPLYDPFTLHIRI